jgi:hypothetical protein
VKDVSLEKKLQANINNVVKIVESPISKKQKATLLEMEAEYIYSYLRYLIDSLKEEK